MRFTTGLITVAGNALRFGRTSCCWLALLLLASTSFAADSPYKGVTLRFLTNANVHQKALAKQFETIAKQWGMNIDVRYVTTDQLAKKVVLDYVAGADTWDLVYTGGVQRMYEWYAGGILVDLAPMIKKDGDAKTLDWDGFTEGARRAVQLDGKILGLAVATSDQALAYRKDLFNNAAEKAAFKTRFGYDLAPPETYAQFRDVAQFFTRKKGEKLAGNVLSNDFYGASSADKNGTFLWHTYENLILAFGVKLYDPATKKVGLLSPASVAAATFIQSIVPYLPPDHALMSTAESTNHFVNGEVAMFVEYFDRVVGAVGQEKSIIKSDQVGYVFPPTEPGNPLGRKHAFRSGPAVVGIYGRSRNKLAAYKLLEAAMSTQSQIQMMHDTPGYMPTKLVALQQLSKENPVTEYLVKVGSSDICACTDVVVMPYPSILKSSEIEDAISDSVSAILTGANVQNELAKAQARVEKAVSTLH
ncbi:MAG: extracellular solute-binding protein [Casimicrobiaceae bacterium]